MSEENLASGHTPIWNYTASGINWVFKNEIWKDRSTLSQDFYCVPEGIKLNLLVSIASVIEGSTKTYLRNKIYELIERKKQLDEIIFEHEREEPSLSEIESSTDENEENDFEQDFISFSPAIEELKNEAREKGKLINDIISKYPDKKTTIDKALDGVKSFLKFNKKFESKEEEKLKNIVKDIEESTWNNLVPQFNIINPRKLKSVLDEQSNGLYEDVFKIFQFRNFIAHSNVMEQNFNENEVHFNGKAGKLIEYINDKGFGVNPVKGKYFVQLLIPDDLIIHFKKCMDLYIENKDFKEDFNTSNLSNLIWR